MDYEWNKLLIMDQVSWMQVIFIMDYLESNTLDEVIKELHKCNSIPRGGDLSCNYTI